MSDPLELAEWLETSASVEDSPWPDRAAKSRAAAAALRAGATVTRERDEALAALRAVVSRRSEGSFVKALDDAKALLTKVKTT